ncbi:MAG TPA: DUF3999 family protein [Phycisphaerae bacterium]|nr:DUF3999 family protein [Phycisphaerae bacterium]
MTVRLPIRQIAFAATMLAALAGASGATPDVAQWTHVAPVEIKDTPGKGLIELPLTPEVFAAASPSLGDLRLADTAGKFIPYVLRTDQGASWTDSYQPRLFNATFVPGRESSITADFGIKATRTRIDIDTPGTNFRRRVRIEASADGNTWQVLKASDWLVRVAYEQGSYNKSEVILPDNDFRYLRVTVYNVPEDAERVDIRSITAFRGQARPALATDVPTRSVTTRQEAKETAIEVDLGYENLPLSEMSLAFDDPNFLRHVSISGRNVRTRTVTEPVENSQPITREVEEPWSSIASTTLYRFPGGDGLAPSEALMLPIRSQYRYLLVQIQNGDDAPLKFSGIKVRRLEEFLAFRADVQGPVQLYAGNPDASAPNYDLASFAARLRSDGVTPAHLGSLMTNPRFAAKTTTVPWSERHAVLLWSSLVAIVVVLGVLVMRQARSARASVADSAK